jgi:hypothetical protein
MEARRTTSFFRQLRVPIIGLLENMVDFSCPHCEKPIKPFGGTEGERVAQDLGIPFLGKIPVDPEVAKCGDKGEPFITSAGQSMAACNLREIAERCRVLMQERVQFTLVTKILYK